jgi:RNA-directed DNA polymerase
MSPSSIQVALFLKERGLELSHEKTSITYVEDGFDFLGQNVRTFLAKIDDLIQHEGGHLSARELVKRLNPKIRGWALITGTHRAHERSRVSIM